MHIFCLTEDEVFKTFNDIVKDWKDMYQNILETEYKVVLDLKIV